MLGMVLNLECLATAVQRYPKFLTTKISAITIKNLVTQNLIRERNPTTPTNIMPEAN